MASKRYYPGMHAPWLPGRIVMGLAGLSNGAAATVAQSNQLYRNALSASRVADEAMLRIIHGLVS